MFNYAILTVSDGVASGHREDISGVAIKQAMSGDIYALFESAVVPDEYDLIAAKLREWCKEENLQLILTTGGTGLSPRDVTPQATESIGGYVVPGIGELMRSCTQKQTPMAFLSRATAVVYRGTLVINLPGSPKGVSEMLASVLPILPHALQIIGGNTAHN